MQTRRSASCTDVEALREWFDPLLLARFRDVCIRTGLEPFEPRVLSCKLTAWHDGCFFHLHQDRATGPAATRRLGFLYYFDFPPRRFHGGELLLYDRDPDSLWPRPSFTNIPPHNNALAVIPSHCWHEVLPVRIEDREDWYAGRFTFSGWFHDAALMDEEEE
jgi:Rps23 Pro-64 3,4-dihydroxylase Tpa1-like proline 4-hydroxylase